MPAIPDMLRVLRDTFIVAPSNGQALMHDGTLWTNRAVTTADITGLNAYLADKASLANDNDFTGGNAQRFRRTGDNTVTASIDAQTGVFTGVGSGLTSLPAANLTGTVADARLSSNVPLKNANNVFTGTIQAPKTSLIAGDIGTGTPASQGVLTLQTTAGNSTGDTNRYPLVILSPNGTAVAYISSNGQTVFTGAENRFGSMNFGTVSGSAAMWRNGGVNTAGLRITTADRILASGATDDGSSAFQIGGVLKVASSIGLATTSFGGGVGVMAMANRTTAPAVAPIGGDVAYTELGIKKYMSAAGNVAVWDDGYFNQGPAYLFTPSRLRKWRLALAKARNGVQDAKILCVGDSTTSGFGASNTPYTLGGWIPRLAERMRESGYAKASVGLGIPESYYYSTTDGRWTIGSGWTEDDWGFGSGAAFGSGANNSNALVYTPGVLADRYDVYYLRASGTGTINVTATGGSTTNQNTDNATPIIAKLTVSAASASAANTVSITTGATGTNSFIIGIEPWLSTEKRVRIANAGVVASTSTNWVSLPAGLNLGGRHSIAFYAPDLTLLSLGLNDATASLSASTFKTQMQQLITDAKISGDVILWTPPPPQAGGDANRDTYLPQYLPIYRQLADENQIPLIELHERWGRVYQNGTFATDGIHPNDSGYDDIASAVHACLASIS